VIHQIKFREKTPIENNIVICFCFTRDRQHVLALWNLTQDLNILHPANWSEIAERVLENYTQVVFRAAKMDGWNGDWSDGDSQIQWTFAGSLLYSATVITTIGKSVMIIMSKTGIR